MAPDVTTLLHDLAAPDAVGRDLARDRLLAAVYEELRLLARGRLRLERGGHTLDTTALVHEAYLRMIDPALVGWTDRAHFFGVAAQAMRRVLVDWARAHQTAKRGAGHRAVSLDALTEAGASLPAEARAEAVLALDEALDRLATFDARKAAVVECRFLTGLSVEETAEALGVSPTTVKTDWALARAWLHRELAAPAAPSCDGSRS